MVRPAREGEALAIAGGLWLGGQRPLVAVQSTGLFEAGDALRNLVYDLRLPLFLIVGCRGYFAQRAGSADTAQHFAEPMLQAWELSYTVVDRPTSAGQLGAVYCQAQLAGASHVLLLAE